MMKCAWCNTSVLLTTIIFEVLFLKYTQALPRHKRQTDLAASCKQCTTILDCINYGSVNFVCTWIGPENFDGITYNATYHFINEDNAHVQNECSNLIHHKDNNRMSCLWTLPLDYQFLYFRINMMNHFGTTVLNKVIEDFEYMSAGRSADYPYLLQSSSSATTSKPLPIQQPTMEDRTSRYKVVCYIDNGGHSFLSNYTDPSLCTHIVLAYAQLDEKSLSFQAGDGIKPFYKDVTAYKEKGAKVLLGFAGWGDSGHAKYSRLVNDPAARKQFIANAINYIQKNHFDGLELAWFYPKCWKGDCSKGPDSDKPSFAAFVKELHDVFQPKSLLLSVFISHNKIHIDSGYDIPTLSRYLDWITVMSFEYHGFWNGVTGHGAPLYVHDKDTNIEANVDFTINYLIEQGADRRKIMMTLPAFGQMFTLQSNDKNLNAPTSGGKPYSFVEICQSITENWTVVHDPKRRLGPYAYSTDQWISFDDMGMIQYKAEYIKNMDLGGAMFWSLDNDDFNNVCACGNYPLLKTVNRVLRNFFQPIPVCRLNVKKQLEQEVPLHEAVVF